MRGTAVDALRLLTAGRGVVGEIGRRRRSEGRSGSGGSGIRGREVKGGGRCGRVGGAVAEVRMLKEGFMSMDVNQSRGCGVAGSAVNHSCWKRGPRRLWHGGG